MGNITGEKQVYSSLKQGKIQGEMQGKTLQWSIKGEKSQERCRVKHYSAKSTGQQLTGLGQGQSKAGENTGETHLSTGGETQGEMQGQSVAGENTGETHLSTGGETQVKTTTILNELVKLSI